MSTPGHDPTRTSIRLTALARWVAGALFAASTGTACLAGFPVAAQAQQAVTGSHRATPARAEPIVAPLSAAGQFCAHLTAAKVSAAVGTGVSLFEAVAKGRLLECIYFGTKLVVSRPEVVISIDPGIPASQLSTLAAAEARVQALSPPGVKLVFTALPTIGATAFIWTYQHSLNGGQVAGIADNKKTTGYGAVVGGAAKDFGSTARHVTALERLLALDISA